MKSDCMDHMTKIEECECKRNTLGERGRKQQFYCGHVECEKPIDFTEEVSNKQMGCVSLELRGEIGLERLILWSTAYLA